MAKKLTKEQKRALLIDSYFSNENDDDPLVQQVRASLAEREEKRKQQAQAPKLESASPVVEEDNDPSFIQDILASLSNLGDAAAGGVKRTVGSAVYTAADSDSAKQRQLAELFKFGARAFDISNGGIAGAVEDDINAIVSGGNPITAEQYATQLRKRGLDQVEEAVEFAKNKSVLPETIAVGAVDLVSSPSSVASVFGGPAAAIPAADVYAQEYASGRLEGKLTREQARARAGTMAGIEGAISSVPAAKVLKKLGLDLLPDSVVGNATGEILKRVAKTAAGESIEEMGTTLAQVGVDKVISETTSDENLRKFSHENTLNLWEQVKRAGVAGAMGGGSVGSVPASLEVAAERGRLAAKMIDTNERNFRELGSEKPKTPAVVAPTQDIDMFGTPEGLPTVEEYEAQRRKDLETDAGIALGRKKAGEVDTRERTIQGIRQQIDAELQNVELLQDKLESGEYSEADANSLTAAVRRVRTLQSELGQVQSTPLTQETPKPKTEVKEPKQLTLNVDAPQTGVANVAERSAKLKEANDLIKKDQADIKKAAERKLKADRGAARRKIMEQSRSISDENERTAFVANELEAWEKTNTLDKYVAKLGTPAAPKKGGKVTSVAKPAAKVDTATEESLRKKYLDAGFDAKEVDTMVKEDLAKAGPKSLEQMKRENGLNSVGSDTKGDLKRGDVISELGRKVRTSDGSVAAKLIADGNVVVVDDASQVPGGADPRGDGFYDGKRIYVVANKLDKNNIVGSLMSVAAHEVKHGADFGAGKKTKARLGNIIGKKANSALVKQIEGLGNTDAKVAEMVKFVKENAPDAYELELPAYFIQLARARRDEKGALRRVANNVTAAVRQGARNTLGVDLDINESDVAYLSDRLLKEVANEGARLEGDTNGSVLPMIGGSEATGMKNARAKGTSYVGPDGKERFAFSDVDAKVDYDKLAALEGNEGLLSEVLTHPEFRKQYPGVMDYFNVKVDPNMKSGNAKYMPFPSGTVVVPKADVDASAYDGRTRNKLREVILHEFQHGLQDYEDMARGGTTKEFMSDDIKNKIAARDTFTSALRKQIVKLNLDKTIMPKLSEDDQEYLREMYAEFGSSNTDLITLGRVIGDVFLQYEGQPLEQIGLSLLDTVNSIKSLQTEIGPAEVEAFRKYQRLYGEKEARFVQNNTNATQDELDTMAVGDTVENGEGVGESIVLSQGSRYSGPFASNFSSFMEGAIDKVNNPSTHRFVRLVKSQALTDGGLGNEFLQLLEQNAGESALSSSVAVNYAKNLESGIGKMAKRTNQTEDQVRNFIDDRLQKIAEIDDKTRREAALGRLVEVNPELRPLMDSMLEINRLSRVLLGQMLRSYPNPTNDQLKTMQAIDANSFRYFTRFYAAFQGEAGRKHSRKMLEDAAKVAKKGVDNPKLTPAMKENFRIYSNALELIKKNDIVIPDDSALEEVKMDKLDGLYHTWIDSKVDEAKQKIREQAKRMGVKTKDIDSVVRQTMIDELTSYRDTKLNDQDIASKADALVKELLGLTDSGSPIAKFYRGFTEDRSILEHRKDIPQELRDLFGEVKDPAQRVLMTISKQGELAARTKMLLAMRDAGLGKWVVSTTDAGKAGNEKFTVALKGDTLGPLDGYSTTPEIAAVVNNAVELTTSVDDALGRSFINSNAFADTFWAKTGRGVTSLARLNKMMMVVVSGFGMMANFVSSPLGLVANGMANPKYIKDGVGVENILHTLFDNKGELSDNYKRAVKYGLLDSGQIQELRKIPQRFVREAVSTNPELLRKSSHKWRVGSRTLVELFATSDAWIKPVIFAERLDVLSKFYAAEGITKSQEDIELEAANDTKNTTITYSRVPPALKNLETVGLTMFMPYFYASFRSLGYNALLGYRDFIRGVNAKNKEAGMILQLAGMRRAGGAAAVAALVPIMFKALAEAVMGEDEEEARKLLSEDAQLPDSVYLGKDKVGNPQYLRLSRFDPYGPATDMVRLMLSEEIPAEDKTRMALDRFKDLWFANRTLGTLLKAGFGMTTEEQVKGRNTRLERALPETTDRVKGLLNSVTPLDYQNVETVIEVLDTLFPSGVANPMDPRNNAVEKPQSPWAAFASSAVYLTGGRVDTADPGLAAALSGKKVKTVRDEGRGRIASKVSIGRDADNIEDTFIEYAEKEYNAMRDAKRVYEGMVYGMKMRPQQAAEILKEGGFTETDIAGFRQARILQDSESWIKNGSRMLVKSSIEERTKTETKSMTPVEKRAHEKKIADAIRNLKAAGYKVREK